MSIVHLHLVSDATGETVNSIARACLSQFDGVQFSEHFWNLVRTQKQLDQVCDGIRLSPGFVMFTLVDSVLRSRLESFCKEMSLPSISVLDPLIQVLGNYLGIESRQQPGRQHALDAEYFSRMDAMDFALTHDDGQAAWELFDADIILVGVSRTSKTPTCIYLANSKGIRAANVPYVPGCQLPTELNLVKKPLIIGLTTNSERLTQIRRTRIKLLNCNIDETYSDINVVKSEVLEAHRYFIKMGWPVIDVSRKSIEETAAEILSIYSIYKNKTQTES